MLMLLRYLTSLNNKQEINKYKVMYIEQLERIKISLWPQKTVFKVRDISKTSYKEVSSYLIKFCRFGIDNWAWHLHQIKYQIKYLSFEARLLLALLLFMVRLAGFGNKLTASNYLVKVSLGNYHVK